MSTKKLNLDDFAEVSIETLLEVKGASGSPCGGSSSQQEDGYSKGLWDKFGTKVFTAMGNYILKSVTGIGMLLTDGGAAQNHRDGNEMAPNGMQWSNWDAFNSSHSADSGGIPGSGAFNFGGGEMRQHGPAPEHCLEKQESMFLDYKIQFANLG